MFRPPDPDRPPTLVAIPTGPDAAGSIGRGEVVGCPGRSAEAYYRRRRAAEWTLYRRHLPLRLIGVVAAGLLSGVAAQEVAPALAGWLAALTSFGIGWRLRFRVSGEARNWRRGARGERRTARQLDRLTDRGWLVFHDLASSVSDPTSFLWSVHCRVNESWRSVRKPQVSAAAGARVFLQFVTLLQRSCWFL
jgi:hypothetical protein